MTTRRALLKAALATGAATMFSGTLGGLRALAQTGTPVRRSLSGMPLNDPDLEAYRSFVGMMQGFDQSKPLSWLGYSLQHGHWDFATQTGAYKYCPHGDWYFLPWHRAYVVMYENAVRALTGYKQFAMPYWDWTVERTMPSAFTDKTYNGRPNPLYVEGRTLNTSDWPLKDSVVGMQVMRSIYKETLFQRFGTSKNAAQNDLNMSWVVRGGGTQGILEFTPHNTVHNVIGYFMPTPASPRDPVFMMHHGNIDRIWAYWNAAGNSNTSGMGPATQTLWLKMSFTDNFLSPTGTPYSAVVENLQDTVALGYTYAKLPTAVKVQVDEERNRRLLALLAFGEAGERLENLQVLAAPNRQAATLDKPLVKEAQLREPLRGLITRKAVPEGPRTPEVYALIKDIQVSPEAEGMRVFVNADSVSAETPDSDPHFVAEVSFLLHGDGSHGGDHKAPPSVLVELTDTLRNLAGQGQLKDDTISLYLVAVLRQGADAAKARIVPATVEIAVL